MEELKRIMAPELINRIDDIVVFNPLKRDEISKILDIQMEIKRKEDMTGLASLYGSGMFIVNFPYKLDEEMKSILPDLNRILGETASDWSVELR